MNNIPKNWELKKLGDVCDFQNGFAFQSSLYREQGTPLITIGNIQNNSITIGKTVYVDKKDYTQDLTPYIIKKGDVLIAMSGATTGKIGINQHTQELFLNQRVGKFNPTHINRLYLFYFLLIKSEENLKKSLGMAQPNLSSKQIKNIKIPVPPLSEQQRIVSVLADVDAVVSNCRVALDTAEKLPLALFIKTFGDPHQNPHTYPMKKLGDVLDYEQPTKYIVQNTEYKDSYSIPVLTAGKSFLLGYTNETNNIYDKGNCIIFDDFTTAIKYVDFKYKVKSSAMKILTPKTENNLYFIYLSMQLLKFNASSHKRYWISEYSNIKIPIPPLSEQWVFMEKMQGVENMIADRKSALATADRLFESTLHKVFSGA